MVFNGFSQSMTPLLWFFFWIFMFILVLKICKTHNSRQKGCLFGSQFVDSWLFSLACGETHTVEGIMKPSSHFHGAMKQTGSTCIGRLPLPTTSNAWDGATHIQGRCWRLGPPSLEIPHRHNQFSLLTSWRAPSPVKSTLTTTTFSNFIYYLWNLCFSHYQKGFMTS